MRDETSPEQAYYENEPLWARDFDSDPQERIRLDAAVALMPADVGSVLDVGCGNGAFVHRLAGRYERICAVDRSETALRFVRTEKRTAGADALPFADGEFDLVSCMEVLEHLQQGTYERALAELVRVSRRWIMISVPCREDRRVDLVRCPRCLCEFNRSYHLRDFDDARVTGLFTTPGHDARLVALQTIGQTVTHPGLPAVKRVLAPLRARALPAGVVCPQCAHGTSRGENRPGAAGRIRRLWPRITRPRWYLALFRRP